MNFKLTKNNGSDIGFALTCLMCGAIHFREFKEWLYFVIENADTPPSYVYDMLDVKLRVDFKPSDLMGWTAGSALSDDELDALQGIGFHRGISDFEDRITKQEALQKLKANDAFFNRVQAFFPFLNLEEVVGPDPGKGW